MTLSIDPSLRSTSVSVLARIDETGKKKFAKSSTRFSEQRGADLFRYLNGDSLSNEGSMVYDVLMIYAARSWFIDSHASLSPVVKRVRTDEVKVQESEKETKEETSRVTKLPSREGDKKRETIEEV